MQRGTPKTAGLAEYCVATLLTVTPVRSFRIKICMYYVGKCDFMAVRHFTSIWLFLQNFAQ
jgi:hypothetical protein